jgi:hypothetical protein
MTLNPLKRPILMIPLCVSVFLAAGSFMPEWTPDGGFWKFQFSLWKAAKLRSEKVGSAGPLYAVDVLTATLEVIEFNYRTALRYLIYGAGVGWIAFRLLSDKNDREVKRNGNQSSNEPKQSVLRVNESGET